MNSACKFNINLKIVLFIGLGSFSALAETPKQELATLQVEVERLSRENKKLKESLVSSKINHQASSAMLSKASSRLALHESQISNLDCYEQQEILLGKINNLENKVQKVRWNLTSLKEAIEKFSSTAVTNNVSDLNGLESALRSSDELLHETKVSQKSDVTSLKKAKVISIDQETGLFVLNVGRINDAQIGMLFDIKRGSLKIASAILVEARKNISGLLIQQLEQQDLLIELGDRATLAKKY